MAASQIEKTVRSRLAAGVVIRRVTGLGLARCALAAREHSTKRCAVIYGARPSDGRMYPYSTDSGIASSKPIDKNRQATQANHLTSHYSTFCARTPHQSEAERDESRAVGCPRKF